MTSKLQWILPKKKKFNEADSYFINLQWKTRNI